MTIHGNKAQNARERALAAFRIGSAQVLVASDIAARGIDVDGVTHVIQFDLLEVPETYVHRIGRTARAGALSEAVALCSHEDRDKLRAIERLIRQTIPAETRPGGDGRGNRCPAEGGPAAAAEPQHRPAGHVKPLEPKRDAQPARPHTSASAPRRDRSWREADSGTGLRRRRSCGGGTDRTVRPGERTPPPPHNRPSLPHPSLSV